MTNTQTPKYSEQWPKYEITRELEIPTKMPRPEAFGPAWVITAKPMPAPDAILFIVLFTVIPLLMLIISLSQREWSFALVVGLFFLVPLYLLSLFITYSIKYFRSKRFGSPLLVLSAPEFQAGDTVRLEFRRDPRPGVSLGKGFLSARLLCVEITRTEVGSNVQHNHAIRYEQDLGRVPLAPEHQVLEGLWQAHIPANATPTQIAQNHWLVWQVQVRQVVNGQLDELSDFLLDVNPS